MSCNAKASRITNLTLHQCRFLKSMWCCAGPRSPNTRLSDSTLEALLHASVQRTHE
jgi:hypothetical protein